MGTNANAQDEGGRSTDPNQHKIEQSRRAAKSIPLPYIAPATLAPPTGPKEVPVRVDFGGGWLDVPRFARPNSYVVNCAITPMVSLKHWGYERNGGLGGSAAYSVLLGNNAVETELQLGIGWQDPAIISETGLCSWISGPRPVLDMKTSGEWLRGLMALCWTGKPHNTPSLVSLNRNWDLIVEAGHMCRNAVRASSLPLLADGINTSYAVQRQEGMDDLPVVGEAAKKYCGGGFGGYALYLFTNSTSRQAFVAAGPGRIAIEPFIRQPARI